LELRVHEVCQISSGGSHVTVYEAEIDFTAGAVQVDIASDCLVDGDSVALPAAREAIRRGANAVLESRGIGAVILIRRIVLHPIDFNPRRFQKHTALEIVRLLDESCESPRSSG
jgi:hypothetical protein